MRLLVVAGSPPVAPGGRRKAMPLPRSVTERATNMADKRIQVIIRGRVQGVGFRASCQHAAVALGLTGWVRNRWDGAVEALFEGPEAKVDAMLMWCYQGPPMADVTSVEVAALPDASPGRGFRVR